MRIHYLTNRATPYKNDQINAWRSVLPKNSLQMWYLHDTVGENLWSKDTVDDKNISVTFLQGFREWCSFVSQLRGSVLFIGGYYDWPYWLALMLAKLLRVPAVLVFDGCNPKQINMKSRAHFLKKAFVKLCDAHFANGVVGRKFIHSLSPKALVFDQVLFVDNEISLEKNELIDSLEQINSVKRVVFCGRLVYRKRVSDLIEAISRISNISIQLLIIGDGPELHNLQEQAKNLNVNVRFVGAVSERSVVFDYLSHSDLLVLPSENEPWGMVVNEALLQGVRVLVSDECGCAHDLVNHQDVAGVFPCKNIDVLKAELLRLLNFPTRVPVDHAVMLINDKQRSIKEFIGLINTLKPSWSL